jgi:hypothetical protein
LRAYFFVANQTSGQDIWNPCAKDKAELVNAEVPEKTATSVAQIQKSNRDSVVMICVL